MEERPEVEEYRETAVCNRKVQFDTANPQKGNRQKGFEGAMGTMLCLGEDRIVIHRDIAGQEQERRGPRRASDEKAWMRARSKER